MRRLRTAAIWGTVISVDVREPCDERLLDDTFMWFREVDATFSTWRSDSEINRLARGDIDLADASDELQTVLDLCDEMCELSRGAFDARFAADPRVPAREGRAPIDPSGIVKGWALARAASRLRDRGVTSFAIAAGGDVVVAGEPAPGRGWRVGVQHPWHRHRVAASVEVRDKGVATSGRYERGDHVLDPRSGQPATGLASVTVVADDLGLADACATAALVLGEDGMDWLTDEMGLAALVVTNDRKVVANGSFDACRCDRARSGAERRGDAQQRVAVDIAGDGDDEAGLGRDAPEVGREAGLVHELHGHTAVGRRVDRDP
jgi:thiamine biosynthesis lipoprotein